MKKIQLHEIEPLLGKTYSVKGIEFFPFSKIDTIFEADENTITWVNPLRKDTQELLDNTKSKLIICDANQDVERFLSDKCFIVVDNPRLAFTRIIGTFFEQKKTYPKGIHPTAIIDPAAQIHESVHIGAYCVVGNCEIAEGSIILPFNRIHDNIRIGKNVKINEHCNIGGDGFGYIWDEEGKLVKMPHIGKLIIEDDVEILQFVNIDKGTLDRTLIKRGAVLDHHVHIGHNATVGENSLIGAKAVFCGGSSVGNNSFIGIQTIIVDAMRVGNNVLVGAGSVVTKAIPDGEKWTGAPARPLSEFVRINKKLSEL